MYSGVVRWALAGLLAGSVHGIEVDVTSSSSLKSASKQVAANMMNYYTGDQPGDNPGNLPQPYYWWEAGGMFMHMVDYYYYTGDSTWNAATIQAIDWQAGTDGTFMPQNQTKDEGNDDQVFWAYASMSAAELKFPAPATGYPSWAAQAQAVFNLQAERWDDTTCDGGLRWQIISLNNGYNYKNMASNGGFFQLAARLGRYTGNDTYTHWAEKMWTWIDNSNLINKDNATKWKVNDGATIVGNSCPVPNPAQYSYNYGFLIAGLSYLYNHTSDDAWLTPLNAIMEGLFDIFFPADEIMIEAGCEPENTCQNAAQLNSLTFPSFTIRWLALSAQLVPANAGRILPYIVASGQGAAGQCDGPNNACGYHWTSTTYDGSAGVGQQMSALSAIAANLITVDNLPAPLTLDTGAVSKSDPSAGTGATDGVSTFGPGSEWLHKQITTGDRAGAGILTALLLVVTLAGAYWLVSY